MFLEYDESSPTGFRTKSLADQKIIDPNLIAKNKKLKLFVGLSVAFNVGLLIIAITLLVVVVRSNVGQKPLQSASSVLRNGDDDCSLLYNQDGIAATGSVCVGVTGEFLRVRMAHLDDVVTLNSSRIWIGTDLSLMPRTATGAPDVNSFPYHDLFNFSIPLAAVGYYADPSQCVTTTFNVVVFVMACGTQDSCTAGFGGNTFLRPNQLQERVLAFTLDCQAAPVVGLLAASQGAATVSTTKSGVSLLVCIRGFISNGPGIYTHCDQLAATYGITTKLYLNWRDRPDFIAGAENAADPNPPYNGGDGYLGGLDLPATEAHAKLVRNILNGTKPDFYIVVGHSYGGASAYFLATQGAVELGVPQPDLLFLVDAVFNYAADFKKGKYFSTVTPAKYQTVNWFQRNGAWATLDCTTSSDPVGLCVGGLADFNPCGSVMNALNVCDIQLEYQKSSTCVPQSCTATYCEFFAGFADSNCDSCGLKGCRYPKPGQTLINHVLIETDDCLWNAIQNTVAVVKPCADGTGACSFSLSCPVQTQH